MSVSDLCTIRQCLSLLPLADFSSPLLDYRVRKLSCINLLKIFLASQLCGWDSLARIQAEIEASHDLQSEFGCTISASQLCRRVDDFPSDVLEALFHSIVARFKREADRSGRMTASNVRIVDSTKIKLPAKMSKWTYVDRRHCAVKVHTRLAVLSNGEVFPDRIVPSTGHVSDNEGSDFLVVDPDATYVLDRGYVCYWRMDDWIADNRKFVMRLNSRLIIHQVLHEDAMDPEDPLLLRDAIIFLGKGKYLMKSPIRLVEFKDEQGRLYRIGTTRFDLSAREIADLYRQRWQIELFFRWMKQHVKFATLFAYKPQAVWNHILLAMIAYALLHLLRLTEQIPQTQWDTLRLLRVYAHRSWTQFLQAATRQPSGKTRGRQRREEPPPPYVADSCGVALIKVSPKKAPRKKRK